MVEAIGPVHQPGTFNIEAWDGTRWRGGMDRLTAQDAIQTANRWSREDSRRYRVFDLVGAHIYDTDGTAICEYAALRAAYAAGAMILANEGRHGRPDQYHFLPDPQFTCEPHEYIAVVPWKAPAIEGTSYAPLVEMLNERIRYLVARREQRRRKMERRAAPNGEVRPYDERALQFAEIRLQEAIAVRDALAELVAREKALSLQLERLEACA